MDGMYKGMCLCMDGVFTVLGLLIVILMVCVLYTMTLLGSLVGAFSFLEETRRNNKTIHGVYRKIMCRSLFGE